jgi:hypothetical protein
MGKIERIQVSPGDREQLVKLVRDRNTAQKIVWRSQIALLAGEGIGETEVAKRVGKRVLTVRPLATPLCGQGGGRVVEVLRLDQDCHPNLR